MAGVPSGRGWPTARAGRGRVGRALAWLHKSSSRTRDWGESSSRAPSGRNRCRAAERRPSPGGTRAALALEGWTEAALGRRSLAARTGRGPGARAAGCPGRPLHEQRGARRARCMESHAHGRAAANHPSSHRTRAALVLEHGTGGALVHRAYTTSDGTGDRVPRPGLDGSSFRRGRTRVGRRHGWAGGTGGHRPVVLRSSPRAWLDERSSRVPWPDGSSFRTPVREVREVWERRLRGSAPDHHPTRGVVSRETTSRAIRTDPAAPSTP